jgi:hypothetical protein
VRQKRRMVLSDVFERFVKGSPVGVMARALMERALEPSVLDGLFRKEANKQYEKELLFSSLVNLMALVVCGIRPTVRTAYKGMREFFAIVRRGRCRASRWLCWSQRPDWRRRWWAARTGTPRNAVCWSLCLRRWSRRTSTSRTGTSAHSVSCSASRSGTASLCSVITQTCRSRRRERSDTEGAPRAGKC